MTSTVRPMDPDTTQALADEVVFARQCVEEILDAIGDRLDAADLRFIAQELPIAFTTVVEILAAAGAHVGDVAPTTPRTAAA